MDKQTIHTTAGVPIGDIGGDVLFGKEIKTSNQMI